MCGFQMSYKRWCPNLTQVLFLPGALLYLDIVTLLPALDATASFSTASSPKDKIACAFKVWDTDNTCNYAPLTQYHAGSRYIFSEITHTDKSGQSR